jgi:hypothetical protein
MKLIELLGIATAELQGFTTLERPDFRLEQAEYNSKDKVWEIVVSFLVENTNKRIGSGILAMSTDYQYHRIYKKLLIDGNKAVKALRMFNHKE